MGTKNFYNLQAGKTKKTAKFYLHGMLVFAGLFLFGSSARSQTSFVNATPQYGNVCQDAGATSISNFLVINDAAMGQTLTWSVVSGPTNGSLGGFPYDTTSTGGTITPSGYPTALTYAPNAGYSGNDSFTVQINNGAGYSTTTTVYVTVNPTPGMTVPDDTTICNGAAYSAGFTGTLMGETFSWTNDDTSIGLTSTGMGNGISFTGTDTFSTPISGDITVTPSANGCAGLSQIFTITVNPTPVVNVVPNQSVCAGTADSAEFTGTMGAGYTWTNTNTNIGLASNGTGNIPPFVATNPTDTVINDIITVTPSINGCMGTAEVFTITVNPTPAMNDLPSQVQCNGFPTTQTDFLGSVPGTTYSWVNSNVNIGLPASGGGGDSIASFTATDTTTATIYGVIMVTPSAYGCNGPAQTFTVTVNPTPLLSGTLARYSICDSVPFDLTLTSATPGTSLNWSRAAVTGISNAANSGTNVIDETLANTTPDTAVATYVVTLAANGCNNTQNINVTVSPRLLLSSAATIPAVCDHSPVTYTATSLTSPIYFSWVRDSVAGITPGSNVGSPNISETLSNSTTSPVTVTYIYTLEAYSCTNTQDVTVTVNPNPTLSSSVTPPAICDSTLFHYIGTSATTGAAITWSRGLTAGISNPASSGMDSVNEVLDNTTTAPVTVTYVDTLKYAGCVNIQDVMVPVNPKPTLTSVINPPSICDSTLFTYVPNSATTGFTSSWSRGVIPGISNPASSGMDTIREVLVNTTDSQVAVTYMDTLKVNGCIHVQSVTDTVNPKLLLNTSLTPTAICDSQVFFYIPGSNTANVAYSWSRAFVPGILETANSGTGNPDEQLINTSNISIVDTYVYTLAYDGCHNMERVLATIRPLPTLSSNLNNTICSGTEFNYVPTSNMAVTKYSWTRGAVTGITPATSNDTSGAGSGSVHEVLTDNLTVPVSTIYNYTLNIDGCTNTENVTLNINPSPASVSITTMPGSNLCPGTFFQNFGAATPPPTGITYHWSAVNATVYAEGDSKQFALVNFNNSGRAIVNLTTTSTMTTCGNSAASDTITVGDSVSNNPEVIYYNGQFICLVNSEGYQWGFDDALSLAPTTLTGQVNQIYFNNSPDFTYNYYWVMTTNTNGCTQKSYYNQPLGVTNVNTAIAGLKVFPNPASDVVNVETNPAVDGNVDVEVLNLLGQKVAAATMVNHQAAIGVANLPAGCYLIDCYREGSKLATAKFIKN